MGFDFRLPKITGHTDREQLVQIKSYLYQMVEQLNFAMNNFDTITTSAVERYVSKNSLLRENENVTVDAPATFNAIKSLIIKSADIVEAYYEEINKQLVGEYVAISDFGIFKESTESNISANSTSITENYTNIQELIDVMNNDIDSIETTLIDVNAYIRTGLLYTNDDGIPVYGLEIGQLNTVDEEEVFNKYARFTSDRLSLYDQNGTEVAYISDYKLYITHVEIKGTAIFGAFEINTTKGFRLKYVGRG